jgi:hypothetical protein
MGLDYSAPFFYHPAMDHPPRKSLLASRKIWCTIICAVIPWINWASVQMPVEHVFAAMFPFAAYATGEWSMDWIQVMFRSWNNLKNGDGKPDG